MFLNQNKVGELIKKIRKDNHLTQKEFADLFGVTYQAVSKWENGLNIPDIAILKKISEQFKVDINDLLDGEIKPKSKKYGKYILALASILLVIALVLIYNAWHDHDFVFRTVRSSCDNFTVLGSMAYNNNKTSINISSISCLSDDVEEYSAITCILYEQDGNTKTEISRNTYEGDPISLNDYLNTVEFNIDNYESTCDNYEEDSLSIELRATDQDGNIITYDIPLSLYDSCNSTSS